MKTYTKIKEYNDWEGESWYVFLREDGNEKFIEDLKNTCNKFKMYGTSLEVIESGVPETDVDVLLRHNPEDGYFNLFNKCETIININLDQFEDEESFVNSFYKLSWFRV